MSRTIQLLQGTTRALACFDRRPRRSIAARKTKLVGGSRRPPLHEGVRSHFN
jgi:hypothetical protein